MSHRRGTDPAPPRRGAVAAALEARRPVRVPEPRVERRAAVTLLLRNAGQVEALFVRRADVAGDPWSGHVALPGGHADPADPDLLDTARRELREETGIALEREAYLGRLDDIGPATRRLPPIAVTPWVAWHEADAAVRVNWELRGHLWIPLPALRDPRRRSELRVPGPEGTRVFPSIEYEGYTIWGLTFRIVSDFLSAVPEPDGPGEGARGDAAPAAGSSEMAGE